MSSRIKLISTILVALVAIVLCVRQLHEPDIWWQLRTGEYITEHGEVPKVDVFSYTHEGEPWVNVKWFTEVIMAAVAKSLGPENLMLVQMLALALIGFFLFKLNKAMFGENKRAAILLAVLLVLLAFSFRMNGRPEMVSHILTCVYLYIYQNYRIRSDNTVFLIIPLQMAWANMHEAFGIGMVISIVFVGSFWVEKLLLGKKLNVIRPSIALMLSFAAISINPHGAKMIKHPLDLYFQLSENQFTTENFSFSNKLYWTYASVLAVLFFLLCIMQLIKNRRGGTLDHLSNSFGLGYVAMFFAFFYLALGAYRNIPYFILTAFPLIYYFCLSISNNEAKVYKTIATLSLVFYISVASGLFYKTLLPREQYGLMINPKKSALGAAQFIEDNQIKGKGLTGYLLSSYLLWRLQPDFKTYLDLRDLDVFSREFMKNVLIAYKAPGIRLQDGTTIWSKMLEADDFDYIVAFNDEQFSGFHRFFVHHEPNYILVYADPVASVYVKQNKEHKKLIEKYGMEKEIIFSKYTLVEPNALAKAISYGLWPFYSGFEYDEKQFKKDRRAYLGLVGL